MRERPVLFNTEMVCALLEGQKTETRRLIAAGHLRVLESEYKMRHPEIPDKQILEKLCMPPCEPGDRLWVRETWCAVRDATGWPHGGSIGDELHYLYLADYADLKTELPLVRWKPSIHMPRKAARIFLRVTDVHPERLQEITGEGCLREGVDPDALRSVGADFAKGVFSDVWDSTMTPEKRKSCGWDANPWVWVIRFEMERAG